MCWRKLLQRQQGLFLGKLILGEKTKVNDHYRSESCNWILCPCICFEFGAVLRLCGVEKDLVEHLKYKLQSIKYKIQNTKYNVLRLCGVEKGGEQCHKWPPWKRTTPLTTWLSIWNTKYKDQDNGQNTHIDSIRKDDLFYILILLYLSLFVLFCFVSLNVFVVPPLPTGSSTLAAMCDILWLFFKLYLVPRMEDSFKCKIFEIHTLIKTTQYTIEGTEKSWARVPAFWKRFWHWPHVLTSSAVFGWIGLQLGFYQSKGGTMKVYWWTRKKAIWFVWDECTYNRARSPSEENWLASSNVQ